MGTRETIGFIGLGFMGYGMARNLAVKGFPLTVLGRAKRAPVEDLVGLGATEVKTARAVAERSSVIFLCVTGSRQVESILRDDGGLKEGLQPGSVVVDCSTSDPTSTGALAAELAALGVAFVDAPLGGTPKEAMAGALSTMVGATPEIFARLKPVIDAWAVKAVHIGGTGDGHRMKLINNFLSLGYGAIYAEALTLAGKVGIAPQTFDSVIRGSRMDCGFYQTFMRWTLEGDREAHKFTLANAFKDLRYLESMADAAGTANLMGNAARNSFALAVAGGGAEDFVPMLVDHIARANGLASLSPDPSDT